MKRGKKEAILRIARDQHADNRSRVASHSDCRDDKIGYHGEDDDEKKGAGAREAQQHQPDVPRHSVFLSNLEML